MDTDRAAFFAAMGWDGGRVEVVAGTNQSDNPNKIDLITFDRATKRRSTRRWIDPDDVTELEKTITRLAEQWGNVYVSVGTYDEVPNRHNPGTMTYNRSAPRPRRGFILDDVTDLSALRLPPTWAIETSPDNYQAGYTCTDLLSPKQAEMLGEGAMRIARTDASGWDATQIIRIPGTLNTKPKCIGRAGDPQAGIEPEGWTVRLLFADGPRYTPQQLATAFVPGGLSALGAAKHHRAGTNARTERETSPVDLDVLARLPDGAALMNTPRYRALFRCRPQLAQLAAGETVILPTKYGLRGSGSEQVAVLVVNLLTTGRSGPDKKMVAGLGAPPEDEVRAIALFWRERLRPGCHIGRYMEDVERLICEYTPAGYAPEPTHITGELIPSHPALLPTRKPGRPYGPRDVAADALLRHCATLPVNADGYARTTNAALADGLNISVAYVRLLLRELRTARRIEAHTEPRTLALRLIAQEGEINYHPHLPASEGVNQLRHEGVNLPHEGVNFPYPDRIATRNDAGSGYMENTPPPGTAVLGAGTADAQADRGGVFSCPAPAATTVVLPTVTTPEPVVLPVPTWTLVQCDRVGHPTSYGVCWKAQGPDGTFTDVCDHQDEATFWARRRWATIPAALASPAAPVQVIPTAPVLPPPAPETTTAVEVTAPVVIVAQTPVQTAPRAEMSVIDTLVERIEMARTEIRRTKTERRDRATGKMIERTLVATKVRVRDIVSDVPDALFDDAWKKANDTWGNYRAKLERRDAIGLAQASRSAARQHANAVMKNSPSVKFYAAQSRIAAEICARRGIDLLDPTGKKKLRATQAQAKAQAKGQTERRSKVASLFVSSVAQAPLFEYAPAMCAD